MEIQGSRVLVTGASRGLGRTLAFACAGAGAREVIAGARKREDIERLKADAAAARAPITPVKLDVTIDDSVFLSVLCGEIAVDNNPPQRTQRARRI